MFGMASGNERLLVVALIRASVLHGRLCQHGDQRSSLASISSDLTNNAHHLSLLRLDYRWLD
jgi:hypothetical protein